MKIYVAHSKNFDYVHELYEPLKSCELARAHEFIFPHEPGGVPFHSKKDLHSIDCVLAEVSHPATGVGIELGYADLYGKPILAVCKKGRPVSASVFSVANHVLEYETADDLVNVLAGVLPVQ